MVELPIVELIAILATAPAIYALWAVARIDLLRLVQGARFVRGTVVRHELGSDGFTPIYQFDDGQGPREARGTTAHVNPQPPVGSSTALTYPRRRPDLARPPQNFARFILYAALIAWIGLFTDLLFNWF